MLRILLVFLLCVLSACSSINKIESIRKTGVSPELSIPVHNAPREIEVDIPPGGDTLKVRDSDGKELLIMRAIRDDKGEMVANETLGAAVVSASFKNLAERHGKVDLRFNLRLPASLLDSKWQYRLFPIVVTSGDTLTLEPVYITGDSFRRQQLRGYQQYHRFLSSIITDSTRFIRIGELELFLKRNIPDIYRFKMDSTFVSDSLFLSYYGVSEKEAVDHYTRTMLRRFNDRRKDKSDWMFRRFVKTPLDTAGLRGDFNLQSSENDFFYEYVYPLRVRNKMRKAEVYLSGMIFDNGKQLYEMPQAGPLTFYISSLSTLVDDRKKFKTRIIERREQASATWDILFRCGDYHLDTLYMDNNVQVASVRKTLDAMSSDSVFALDSIRVSASCSPEGPFVLNRRLSGLRASSVADYFHTDSIPVRPKYEGENWTYLMEMVRTVPWLGENDRSACERLMEHSDPDTREVRLKVLPCYSAIRDSLFPRLRTVKLDFFLHRRGMVRDTVHTTELDSVYQKGVDCLKSRDYLAALNHLLPYSDYNTALCFASLDRNHSAMEILNRLPFTAKTGYLLSLVHSRLGNEFEAVENYVKACRADPSLVHRGNLDPEISGLVRKYNINFTNTLQ